MKHTKVIIYTLITLLLINMVTIKASEFIEKEDETTSFEDVQEDFWARDAIIGLANNGILKGKGHNKFYPNDYITRSEFTKVIVSLLKLDLRTNEETSFIDVNKSDWFYPYVNIAYTYNIVSGVSSNSFEPKANISRQDVFTILSRVLTNYGLDASGQKLLASNSDNSSAFTDYKSISSYALTPINTLLYYNLLNGYTDNSLKPKNLMTRAEAASIVYKLADTFELNPQLNSNSNEDSIIKEDTRPSSETGINGKYQLDESNTDMVLWTDYPSERVFKTDKVPEQVAQGIHVYLAKNEFEPFQLILKPKSSKSIKVEVLDQPNDISIEFHRVMYVDLDKNSDNMGQTGQYPDPLYPIDFGQNISVIKDINNPLWFTIKTKEAMASGDYTLNLSIDDIKVPIYIHVFDFAIPKELHVKSQINVSTAQILDKYGVEGTKEDYWFYVDNFKKFMIDHRLTPKSVLWSGGLTSTGGSPYIDYNSSTGEFNDSEGIWGFEYPASRYLDGVSTTSNSYLSPDTFNGGIGFPSFMAMTFTSNDASQDQRPNTFDGISRSDSDWYLRDNITSQYNQKWFSYIKDIESYLIKKNYIDKAYYYMANEPQDQDNYDAVAWYSSWLKKYAPKLKLMVSEEPKAEIYNNTNYPGAKVDIWLPVLNNYNPKESWDREINHNEETWIYFLYGTKPPYFNPITLDHPAIESKLTGWFLWKYRIKGIAHYSFNNWSRNVWDETMVSGHYGDDFVLYPPGLDNEPIEYGATNHRFVTSIRFELMRDSLEDYEYLYVLNNHNQPIVNSNNSADTQVDKIIYGLTSYNRSSDYMYNLRKYIGAKLSNTIKTIPNIEVTNKNQRSNSTSKAFYINFQDPDDSSVDEPLIVGDKTYTKIGWNTYDDELGYGWYGDMDHVKYQNIYNEANPLKSTVIYDDWGRVKTFEYDLPNGSYNVSVSCGWAGRSYKHNKITIEGVDFINDEETSSYIERTKKVLIKDNKLTMEMGIFDEYTMLNYLEIVAIEN